jgi:hypothetical protein
MLWTASLELRRRLVGPVVRVRFAWRGIDRAVVVAGSVLTRDVLPRSEGLVG